MKDETSFISLFRNYFQKPKKKGKKEKKPKKKSKKEKAENLENNKSPEPMLIDDEATNFDVSDFCCTLLLK